MPARNSFRNDNLKPSDLLLDPRNPRLFVDESDYLCDEDDDYAAPHLQRTLRQTLESKKEHKLDELILNIRSKGFQPFSDIYVYPYNGKFLVFEGNRRTAAIKYLIENEWDELDEEVKESLEEIPAKVVQYSNKQELVTIMDDILATTHLNPSLQWQPMQQAFSYYRKYMSFLEDKFKSYTAFQRDSSCMKKLAGYLGRQEKDVIPEIKVYLLYKQLRDGNYTVDGNMYSIIKETLGKPTLLKEYFEYDAKEWEATSTGLERFYRLCLSKDRPVHDPKQVGVLQKCAKAKRFDLLEMLYNGETNIGDVKQTINSFTNDSSFLANLEKIEKTFNQLSYVPNPNETELRTIHKILQHAKGLRKSIGDGFHREEGLISKDEDNVVEIRGANFFYSSHDMSKILPEDEVITIRVENSTTVQFDAFVFDGEEQLYDAEGEPFSNPFVFKSPKDAKLSVYVTTTETKKTGFYKLTCEW